MRKILYILSVIFCTGIIGLQASVSDTIPGATMSQGDESTSVAVDSSISPTEPSRPYRNEASTLAISSYTP